MKILVVSLALTVFAGSQAFVLRDEAPTKLDQIEREINKDMWNLSYKIMEEKRQLVQQSEIGKVLSNWIDDIYAQLSQRMEVLTKAFPPEVEEIRRQVRSALNAVWFIPLKPLRMYKSLSDEIEALLQALDRDLDPIPKKLETYARLLRQELVKVGTGLEEKLDEFLKWSVERLQPLAKELPSKLQEVQGSLDPVLDRAQKVIVTEVENSRDTLQPFASRALEFLRKYGELLDLCC